MHGLNMLDFHARKYDPLLGRFHTMDPLAEKYYSISPYAYCANNPVKYTDPTGESAVVTITNDSTVTVSSNLIMSGGKGSSELAKVKAIQSQVTIGSGNAPTNGTLLQLKENNDTYAWVPMSAKISVEKKLIAIISKASQTIPARGNGTDPITTGVTWNDITGNNAQKIEIRNNTDIYLPPGEDIKITGYIGIESYLVGANPTYIATRFVLVENGGTTDPSKLILSVWGYVKSSTEAYDDGGTSNPVCI